MNFDDISFELATLNAIKMPKNHIGAMNDLQVIMKSKDLSEDLYKESFDNDTGKVVWRVENNAI